MPAHVFFSWQSDRPNAICRSLIERCLESAIKALNAAASVELAERAEVQSGIKGEAGIVPVADTILKRIERSSVVVADLTYVAERASGGGIPNPNVMLEYGYALKSRSGRRMIAVMNTAFGHPRSKPLPFDLAHTTWPILFECSAGSDAAARSDAREGLMKQLTAALKMILGDDCLPSEVPMREPHPHDVVLLEKVYATFPLAFRAFLSQHDFGVQFRAKILDPLHEAAEWVGAAYEFHDHVIQGSFAAVRRYADELTELTSSHIYTYGQSPMVATVKADIDREHGAQPATREAIRKLNGVAAQLADTLDQFERTARDRIPVSSLDVQQSTWPSFG